MNIRDYIPEGHENAVTKKELENRTGLENRRMRELIAIASLDRDAPPICNVGEGYFIARESDIEEVKDFHFKEISRARKIEKRNRQRKRWIDQVETAGYQYAMEIK